MILPPWLVPHMPVIYGLAAGTITKFGMAFESRQLTGRGAVGQLSMLTVLGLMVDAPADLVQAAPSLRALAAAAAALLGAKLIDRLERSALREADARLGTGTPPTP